MWCFRVAEAPPFFGEAGLQVLVRDNNIDQALRVLKKKMQREGVFREMKRRRSYEKPSEKKTREKSEAVRRARKLARKQAIREGLIPAPPKKEFVRKPALPELASSAGAAKK
jgi:small subunit ribosomal protein S21